MAVLTFKTKLAVAVTRNLQPLDLWTFGPHFQLRLIEFAIGRTGPDAGFAFLAIVNPITNKTKERIRSYRDAFVAG